MLFSIRRLVACVALFAMLFSAVSPAFAALRFYNNADVLASVVGIQPTAHHSTEHQHSGHAKSKKHEVYCSFCLDTVSVQALTLAALDLHSCRAATEIQQVESRDESSSSYPAHRPRAPPIAPV